MRTQQPSLASWWLLVVSFLALQVSAKDILKISGFTECQSDAEIFLKHVDIQYDADIKSIKFDVAGSSTKSQNVTATLKVDAYGKQVYTKEFNPCDPTTFVGGLCPVPVGDFSAASTQTIPSEFVDKIPNIAFNVPDVALQATLELKKLETGENVGCVVADLSNGKSVDSPAITYIAAGVVGAALCISAATAALGALSGTNEPGVNTGSSPGFQAMFGWFQTISTTGMLSVDYAPLYRSFTTRFAFASGLIAWTPMQESIDNFRAKTGGNITVNNIHTLQNSTTNLMKRQLLQSNGSTPISPNITKALGIEKYVEETGIVQENAFMTVFLILMIVFLVIAVSILLFKVILEGWALFGNFPKSLTGFRKHFWGSIFRTIVLVIFMIWPVWVLFSVYQFKAGDAWGPTVLAGITLAAFAGVLIFFIVRIWQTARRHIKIEGSAARLFEDKMVWLKYSIFYDNLKKHTWWFFAPLIVYGFTRSVLMAVLNGRGLPQTISIIVLDVIMLGALIFFRPYEGKTENIVHIAMQVIRVLLMGGILVFVDELKVERSTQTVTGFALVIFTSILTVIFVLLMLFSAFYQCCSKNPHRMKRKEAEKLRRESEFFLDPRDEDTSYRSPDMMERGRQQSPHSHSYSHSRSESYSSPHVDPLKVPLASARGV